MDPFELLQMVNEAIRAGVSPEEINATMSQKTRGQFSSIAELSEAAGRARQQPQSSEDAALQRTAERGGSALGDFARGAAQFGTLGFADEIAGVGSGIAAAGKAALSRENVGEAFSTAREEGTEASRQRIADMRELSGGAMLASGLAGGLLGGAAGALGKAGVGAARGLLGARSARGAAAGARAGAQSGVSGQTVSQTLRGNPARKPIHQAMLGIGKGALAGAGIGAVEGAGEAEGGLLDRAPGALGGAQLGGIMGLTAGAAIPLIGVARNAARRTANAGQTLADGIEAVGAQARGRPLMNPVAADQRIRSFHDAGKARFQALEASGEVPTTLHSTIQTDPKLAETLRNMDGIPEAVQKGARPPTFQEAQYVQRQLDSAADVYRTGGQGSAVPNPALAAQAREAADKLDEAMMRDLADYPDAQRAWSMMRSEERARDIGRGLRSVKSADELKVALDRLPEEAKIPTTLSGRDRARYTEHLRDIGRDQVLHKYVTDLLEQRGDWYMAPAEAKKFFKAGTGMEERMRTLFADKEAAETFMRLVENEASAATMSRHLATAIQAGAFLWGGSSLLGQFAR